MRNATTSTRVLHSLLLLALAATSACEIPFRHRQRHPYPAKAVTAKEGISVLVAGTARCLVPTKEFAKVKVGDTYECNWWDSGPAVPPAGE